MTELTGRDRYNKAPRLPEGDVDLSGWLAGEGDLELEIGPGRGGFILERARAAPVRILGIEVRRKWATRVDERLGREGLHPRARVVCDDARLALARLRPDGVLARVFIHFPDPWWKKRHEKRLVIGDPLVANIARLLRAGGELFVQTDVPERADQYRSLIAACTALAPAGDREGAPDLADHPYQARSNRERRAMLDGLPLYRLRWRKTTSAGC